MFMHRRAVAVFVAVVAVVVTMAYSALARDMDTIESGLSARAPRPPTQGKCASSIKSTSRLKWSDVGAAGAGSVPMRIGSLEPSRMPQALDVAVSIVDYMAEVRVAGFGERLLSTTESLNHSLRGATTASGSERPHTWGRPFVPVRLVTQRALKGGQGSICGYLSPLWFDSQLAALLAARNGPVIVMSRATGPEFAGQPWYDFMKRQADMIEGQSGDKYLVSVIDRIYTGSPGHMTDSSGGPAVTLDTITQSIEQ